MFRKLFKKLYITNKCHEKTIFFRYLIVKILKIVFVTYVFIIITKLDFDGV